MLSGQSGLDANRQFQQSSAYNRLPQLHMVVGSHRWGIEASHVLQSSDEHPGEEIPSQRADEPADMASSPQRGIFSRLASKLTRLSRDTGGSIDTTPRTLRSSFTLRKSSERGSFSKPNATLRPSNARSASRSGSMKSVQGTSYNSTNVNTLSRFSDADTAHSSSSSRFFEKANQPVPLLTGLPQHDNPDDSPLLNMLEIGSDVFQHYPSHILNSVSAADSISFLAGLPANSGSPRPTPRISNVQRGPPNPTAWGGGSPAGPPPLHDHQDSEPPGNECTTYPDTPSLDSSATKSTMVMSCTNACKSSSGPTRVNSLSRGGESDLRSSGQEDADLSRSHTPTFIPTDCEDLDAGNYLKLHSCVPKTPQNQRFGLPQLAAPANDAALSPQTPLIVSKNCAPGYGAQYTPEEGAQIWSSGSAPSKPNASNMAVQNIMQSDGTAMQMQAMQSITSVGSPVPNPLGKPGPPLSDPNTLTSSIPHDAVTRNSLEASIHEESVPQLLAEQQLNTHPDKSNSESLTKMDEAIETPKQCSTSGPPDADITARMPFEASPFEMQPPSFCRSSAGDFNADPVTPAKGAEHSPDAPPPHTPPMATPPIRFCASCPHSQSQRAPSLRAFLQENVCTPLEHNEYVTSSKYNCLAPTSEHAQLQCHNFVMHGAHAFGVHEAMQWNLADGLAPTPPSVKQPSYALSSQPVSTDVSQPGSRRVSRPGSLHLPDTHSPPLSGLSAPQGAPQPIPALPVSTLPCHAFNSCSGSTDTQEPAVQHRHTHVSNTAPLAAEGSAYCNGAPAIGSQRLGGEQLQQLAHLRHVISAAWAPCVVDAAMGAPQVPSDVAGDCGRSPGGADVVKSSSTNNQASMSPPAPVNASYKENCASDGARERVAAAIHTTATQQNCSTSNTSRTQPAKTKATPQSRKGPAQTRAASATLKANTIDPTLPPKLKRVPLHRQCTPHPSEAYLPNPSPTKLQPARPSHARASPPSKTTFAHPLTSAIAAPSAAPNHASPGNAPHMFPEASVSSITEPTGDPPNLNVLPPEQTDYPLERSQICQKVLEHLSQCTVTEAAETVRCVENSLRLLLEVNRTMTMHDNMEICMHNMHDEHSASLNQGVPHHPAQPSDTPPDTLTSQRASAHEAGSGAHSKSADAISSHNGAMHTSCVAACVKRAAESARSLTTHHHGHSNLYKPTQGPTYREEPSGAEQEAASSTAVLDDSASSLPYTGNAMRMSRTHHAGLKAADANASLEELGDQKRTAEHSAGPINAVASQGGEDSAAKLQKSRAVQRGLVEAANAALSTSTGFTATQAQLFREPGDSMNALAAPHSVSRAASSVVEALQELAEQIRSDSATSADVATEDNATCMDVMHMNMNMACRDSSSKPSTADTAAGCSEQQSMRQRQGMYLSHVNALALGCTPSVGSTGSGSVMTGLGGPGGLQGGLSGKSKGLWRGSHNVTESFIMHSLHAHAKADTPVGVSGLSSTVQETVSEGPCENAACMGSMHADDIDEIDDASTQLSGRSGSWLCLPGPPPVANGMNGMQMFLSRGGSMHTGSMHISASMNICGDVLGPSSAPMSPKGGAYGVAGATHMARNSSEASHNEVAV